MRLENNNQLDSIKQTLNNHLNKPNEVILSVTNRCEFDVNVWFTPIAVAAAVNEGEEATASKNIVGLNASIDFGDQTGTTAVKIDRQDNAKSQAPAALTQADVETLGLVCFRRENKIAISARVKLVGGGETKRSVRCGFEMKFSNANVVAPAVPATSETTTTTTTSPTTAAVSSPVVSTPSQTVNTPQIVKIYLDLGPVGLQVVPVPKYIEDCLAKK